MLKKRIIPIVLINGFSVLKTIGFEERRNLGSPITVVRTYNTRNVDELVVLDIDASKQCRSIDKFTIGEMARECFMPLTVGGGIRSLENIRDLLLSGADKISINTIAIQDPAFIRKAADEFGSQCIVVSVDVMELGDQRFGIYSNGVELKHLDLFDWLQKVEEMGAGEVLINNVTRDGSMRGANVKLAERVSASVNVPVVFAGGVSSPVDAAAVAEKKVSAVGISSIFHFTDWTPNDCREALKAKGIPAR